MDPPKGDDSTRMEKKKRLIFKSTLFGDDSNRALTKDDLSWTYFANDIGYHSTKVSKKYDYLINVLGADHIGYVKELQLQLELCLEKKIKLICKVCQLVKFMKNGNNLKCQKDLGILSRYKIFK